MDKSAAPNIKKSIKRQDITQLVLAFAIIVLINIISTFVFTRFDLTSEKRYTLSPTTKEFLGKLEDVVYVKVYLEGDFPAGFKRLRNETRELLDEFRIYANGNLEYEFINPSESPDPAVRNDIYKQLNKQGLQATNLETKDKGERKEQVIFPGAIMSYRGEEASLALLNSQIGVGAEQIINNSVQNLEYNIAHAIKNLTTTKFQSIGFLQGHNELTNKQMADIIRALSGSYTIDSVTIRGQLKSLEKFNALIIAKPDTAFNERDKFIIDQFVMKGGKVLWLIDPMRASMDSLSKGAIGLAYARDLNLDDQLFNYGVRINADLVEDIQGAPIPIVTGYIGNQPQQRVYPWYYFPLLMADTKHPIVNNLNAVKCEFASSIDTIGIGNVKKTILLATSDYTKVMKAPVRLSLGILRFEPDMKQFNKKKIPVAVLLEGSFKSVFANRIPPEITENKEIGFKAQSEPTKMLVVSDGDIVKNEFSRGGKGFYPLGYDKVTKETYGNKNFMLNCMDYMLDKSGLIAVRSKELKLRLLDRNTIEKKHLQWQLINILAPLALVISLGAYLNYRRRKKFAA